MRFEKGGMIHQLSSSENDVHGKTSHVCGRGAKQHGAIMGTQVEEILILLEQGVSSIESRGEKGADRGRLETDFDRQGILFDDESFSMGIAIVLIVAMGQIGKEIPLIGG